MTQIFTKRNLLIAGLLLTAVGLVSLLVSLRGEEKGDTFDVFPSTYNGDPFGAKGFRAILEKAHIPFGVYQSRTQRLEDLEGPKTMVLIGPQPGNMRRGYFTPGDAKAYLQWASEGNTLIILDDFQIPGAKYLLKQFGLAAYRYPKALDRSTIIRTELSLYKDPTPENVAKHKESRGLPANMRAATAFQPDWGAMDSDRFTRLWDYPEYFFDPIHRRDTSKSEALDDEDIEEVLSVIEEHFKPKKKSKDDEKSSDADSTEKNQKKIVPNLPKAFRQKISAVEPNPHNGAATNIITPERVMLTGKETRATWLSLPVGQGKVIVASTPYWLSNHMLWHPEWENIQFFITLLQEEGHPILINEFVHGHLDRPGNVLGYLYQTPVGRWLDLFILLMGMILWLSSSSARPRREMIPWSGGVDMLQYVRSMAILYHNRRSAKLILGPIVQEIERLLATRYQIRGLDREQRHQATPLLQDLFQPYDDREEKIQALYRAVDTVEWDETLPTGELTRLSQQLSHIQDTLHHARYARRDPA